MLRKTLFLTVGVLASLAAGVPAASAAGAPTPRGVLPVSTKPLMSHVLRRHEVHRHGSGFNRWYGHRGGLGIGVGLYRSEPALVVEAWPGPVELLRVRRERSFATLPASTGMPRAPTPEPVIYRIEGPRERPVMRVVRIAEAQSGPGRRSRHAYAETGALLLTVPPR